MGRVVQNINGWRAGRSDSGRRENGGNNIDLMKISPDSMRFRQMRRRSHQIRSNFARSDQNLTGLDEISPYPVKISLDLREIALESGKISLESGKISMEKYHYNWKLENNEELEEAYHKISDSY